MSTEESQRRCSKLKASSLPPVHETSKSVGSDGSEASSQLKRERTEYLFDGVGSRSERKRNRERKRRLDVNAGFDELMSLLLELDPEVRAETGGEVEIGAQGDNPLSRVEIMERTVALLGRTHAENEERKHIIASLTRSNAVAAPAPKPLYSNPLLSRLHTTSNAPPVQGNSTIGIRGLTPGSGHRAASSSRLIPSHLSGPSIAASLMGATPGDFPATRRYFQLLHEHQEEDVLAYPAGCRDETELRDHWNF